MIHTDDIAAWIAQVRQNPEAASGIIEALAARLIQLDIQNEALRDELVRQSRTHQPVVDEGRTAALARRVEELERRLGQPGEPTYSLLVFTLDGRGMRTNLPRADAWQQRADATLVASHLRPRHLLLAADDDELLLLTDKGRALRVQVSDIDSAEAPASYLSLLPGSVLELDESISVIMPLSLSFGQMTLITRKGYARSFRRAEVYSLLERGLSLHSSPIAGDYPAFAVTGDGEGDLVIATRLGKGVRFPERQVGVQSKPAINLDRGDVVVGAAIVHSSMTLALVGTGGAAARRDLDGFGAHPTAGNRGKILTRIDNLVGAVQVGAKDVLWLMSEKGALFAVPSSRVPVGPGAASGRVVVRLDEERIVAVAAGKEG